MTLLNATQIEALEPFEKYFHYAIEGDWTPHPGVPALEIMHEALKSVGDQRRLNAGCQHCILSIVRDAGLLYRKSIASLPEKKVEVVEVPEKTIKRKSVKTARK